MYINIVNHHKAWKLLESDVDLQDRLRTAFSSAPWWGWAVGLIGTALRNRPRWLWLVPPPGSALPSRRISECSGWFLCPPLIVGPVRIRMINDDHKPYLLHMYALQSTCTTIFFEHWNRIFYSNISRTEVTPV